MIGQRIKTIRKSSGLVQEGFAGRLKIRQAMLSQYENDAVEPRMDVLKKISSTFNINLHWLLTGNGEMFLGQKNHVLDLSTLQQSIETVEEALEEAGGVMIPKKKSEVIVAIYQLFSDEEEKAYSAIKKNVIHLVRSAVA